MRFVALLFAASTLLAQDVSVTGKAQKGPTSGSSIVTLKKLPGIVSVTCSTTWIYDSIPTTFTCDVQLDRISEQAPYDVKWSVTIAGSPDPRFVAVPETLSIPKGSDKGTVTINFTPTP